MIIACYLDASAIVKLVLKEPGCEKVRDYVGKGALVCVTIVCFAEALGVLKRKYERKLITHPQYLDACAILMGQVRDKAIEIDDKIKLWDWNVFHEVEKVAKRNCLDVSDAFQVIVLKHGTLAPFKGTAAEALVITADGKLAEVLKSEGCKVDELPTS